MHLHRKVVEQESQNIVNLGGINDVIIVQDDDEILRDRGDVIDKGCQNRISGRGLRGVKQRI